MLELHHPLEGSLTEEHREHFFTKEDYERSRELREEKKNAKLTRLIHLMEESLSVVEDAEMRKKMETLVRDITLSALHYIDARIDLARTANQPYRDNDAIMSADRTRRAAHIRLVDSIRIASRNFVQNIQEFRLDPDMAELVGDSHDENVRERVASAAIDLVWELLNQEEDKSRMANK